MNYIIQSNYFQYIAQAYGTGTYSCSTYDTGCATEQTTASPLAPVTGFMRDQPLTIVIPVLLVAAVLLAAIGLLIGKLIKKVRRAKQ